MKVRLKLMVQDPLTAKLGQIIEGFDVSDEDFWLDGPVTRRVAILDFDPKSGRLSPSAQFVAPALEEKLGIYALPEPPDCYSPHFIQVSVLATVLKTLYMLEAKDALGRSLSWAFEAPQLLVVPRAGELANAYYERASHSLQFFFIPPPSKEAKPIYTSLSRDVVSHETGHAILDAIAPDLYDAISPQSLALHEAVADLTALLMAFSSHNLREMVLGQTEGSIRDPNAFSAVAEEFGQALDPKGGAGSLRSLSNAKSLDPQSLNFVAGDEPHALSEVISGALYSIMVAMHEDLRPNVASELGTDEFSASGLALWRAANRFKRLVFRGLDYLPPGEISFADCGRAIIAADQAQYPNIETDRERLAAEFIRRGIVSDREALRVETNFEYAALKQINLDTLVDSDWAAYAFADRNREFFGIPSGINFRVCPRLRVTKYYFDWGPEQSVEEVLFKVSWDHTEPNTLGSGFPSELQITTGTTVVIDANSKKVRAKLTAQVAEQRADRDSLLKRLVDEGRLSVGREAIGPDGKYLRSTIRAEALNGLMRVRETARMLHIA